VTKYVVVGLLCAHLTLPILSGYGSPKIAEASIISAISGVFSPHVADADVPVEANSQKMALLEAPINPVSGKTPEVSSHIENNALVYEPESSSGSSLYIPESNKISAYNVEVGDTVSDIAQKFHISVNTVMGANGLKKDSKLKVGQTLLILPISGVRHTVVSGDTVQGIATKYKGDVDEILAYNDLTNGKLKIGDVVLVPDGELPQTAAQAAVKTTASVVSKITTAVKSVVNASLGYYMRPITAGVRTQGIHGNNGVDLADACGTPIYASAEGDVVIGLSNGAYNGGYGNYVVITHSNGSQTLYAHMQKLVVKQGDHVTQGQNIGTIGATGKVHGVTGCHVHFEIRNGGVNPF
jgi:murein DD-endopeptidase MepM/ murein hydrolase activator NlpD